MRESRVIPHRDEIKAGLEEAGQTQEQVDAAMAARDEAERKAQETYDKHPPSIAYRKPDTA